MGDRGLGERLGDRFSSILKAGKNLPGKILLNLKEGDERQDAITSGGSLVQSTTPLLGGSRSGSIPEDKLGHTGPVGLVVDMLQMKLSGGDGSVGSTAWDPTAGAATGLTKMPRNTVPEHRMNKFHKVLASAVIDLDDLRELCWNGVPAVLRPTCWRLLMGYLPPNKARQAATLGRKRQEYQEMVPQFYEISDLERSEEELTALRQVGLDVPRTAPAVPFFHEPIIQKSLRRLLYIWGIRHPASGYVQGMNDLVTPFLAVFLGEHLPGPIDSWKADQLNEEMLLQVEADCYWCLCKLVEAIQDHYTYAQPGIQRTVFLIHEIVRSAAPSLAQRLEEESIDFIQFAWRWVNCLLIREVPFELSFRLWDTYLAEGHRFADFLVYACASFLELWTEQLEPMEFQDMIMFLQKPPTQDWQEPQLEMVLGRAFILRNQYSAAIDRQNPGLSVN